MTKLTLAEWAAENYKTPPSPNTLRKWAREGRITPKPIKHGRNYYVDANSQYVASVKQGEDRQAILSSKESKQLDGSLDYENHFPDDSETAKAHGGRRV